MSSESYNHSSRPTSNRPVVSRSYVLKTHSETAGMENPIDPTPSKSIVIFERQPSGSDYSSTIKRIFKSVAIALSQNCIVTINRHKISAIISIVPGPSEESDKLLRTRLIQTSQELINPREHMLRQGSQRLQEFLSSINECENSAQELSTIEGFSERLHVTVVVFNVLELRRMARGIDKIFLQYSGVRLPMVKKDYNLVLTHLEVINADFTNQLDWILSRNHYQIFDLVILGGGVCGVSALLEILERPNFHKYHIVFVDCLDRSYGTNSTEDSTEVSHRGQAVMTRGTNSTEDSLEVFYRGQAAMARSSLRLLTAHIKQLIRSESFSNNDFRSNKAMRKIWRIARNEIRAEMSHFIYSFRKLLAANKVTYYRGVTQFLGKDFISVSMEHQDERETIIIRGMKFLVSSGESTIIPECVGNQHCLTISEYLFTTAGPLENRILIIGNTPAVFEAAYAFALCGRKVTVLSEEPWLPHYDEECTNILLNTLRVQKIINFERVKKINGIYRMPRSNRWEVWVIWSNGSRDIYTFDLILCDYGSKAIDLRIKNTGVSTDPETGKVIVVGEYESTVPDISVIGRLAQGHPDSLTFEEAAGRRAIEMIFDGTYKGRLPSKIQPSFITADLVYASVGESEASALRKYKQNTRIYRTVLPRLSWFDKRSHLKEFYYGKVICRAEGTGCNLSDASEYVVGVHLIGSNLEKYIEEFATAVRIGATKQQCSLLPCVHSSLVMGDLWRNLIRKVINIRVPAPSTSVCVLPSIPRHTGEPKQYADRISGQYGYSPFKLSFNVSRKKTNNEYKIEYKASHELYFDQNFPCSHIPNERIIELRQLHAESQVFVQNFQFKWEVSTITISEECRLVRTTFKQINLIDNTVRMSEIWSYYVIIKSENRPKIIESEKVPEAENNSRDDVDYEELYMAVPDEYRPKIKKSVEVPEQTEYSDNELLMDLEKFLPTDRDLWKSYINLLDLDDDFDEVFPCSGAPICRCFLTEDRHSSFDEEPSVNIPEIEYQERTIYTHHNLEYRIGNHDSELSLNITRSSQNHSEIHGDCTTLQQPEDNEPQLPKDSNLQGILARKSKSNLDIISKEKEAINEGSTNTIETDGTKELQCPSDLDFMAVYLTNLNRLIEVFVKRLNSLKSKQVRARKNRFFDNDSTTDDNEENLEGNKK